MQRSEIWRPTLPPPVGSSPGGRRPVLVLQSDRFNRSRISTIVIATITSNLNLANSPGNVLLPESLLASLRVGIFRASFETGNRHWNMRPLQRTRSGI